MPFGSLGSTLRRHCHCEMQHSELCFNKPANSSVATRRWGKTFRLIAHPASKLVDPPGSSPDVHPFPVTRGTPPHIESLQRAERNEPLRSLHCTASLQRRLSTATYCSFIVFVRCVTPRAAMHAHRSKTARRSAAALPRRCRRSRRKPNRQGRPSSSLRRPPPARSLVAIVGMPQPLSATESTAQYQSRRSRRSL